MIQGAGFLLTPVMFICTGSSPFREYRSILSLEPSVYVVAERRFAKCADIVRYERSGSHDSYLFFSLF